MKLRNYVFASLLIAVVLFVSYGSINAAPPVAAGGSKIGVVSIRTIFENSKKNDKYMEDAKAEQDRIIAELEKLSKETEASEAELKTLVVGSVDYIALSKKIFEKKAQLEALKEFHKQRFTMQDKKWTEDSYVEILNLVAEVAKSHGLTAVFAKDEVHFPAATGDDLMLTIRTNKLLYDGGCVDITDDVMAQFDATISK